MKKIILLFCLVALISPELYAFSYRCLEGGMTKEEFHEACNSSKFLEGTSYSKKDAELDLHFGYKFEGTPLEGKMPRIYLSWTDDGLLWRAQLEFSKSGDPIKNIALINKLSEKFGKFEKSSSKYILLLIHEPTLNKAVRIKEDNIDL